MTDKEMRKLSRAELLEMMIEQSTQIHTLQEQLEIAEEKLHKKEIAIDQAGSIAEAALQLNHIFEAAQDACQQYTDNIRLLSERQESICQKIENESREKAEAYEAEVTKRCEQMETDTKVRCAEMTAKAKAESQEYWSALSQKLEDFYQAHASLQEFLDKKTVMDEMKKAGTV